MISVMHTAEQLARMNAESMRSLAAQLIAEVTDVRRDNALKQLKIDQLTHEMAILKRWKFAARSEQLSPTQRHLFEETIEADLEAIGLELEALKRTEQRTRPKQTPRRMPLRPDLLRTEIRHEPDAAVCPCGCTLKRIGEDVSEKLDYVPGVFSVERHIRGKWARPIPGNPHPPVRKTGRRLNA
jgi:transposase